MLGRRLPGEWDAGPPGRGAVSLFGGAAAGGHPRALPRQGLHRCDTCVPRMLKGPCSAPRISESCGAVHLLKRVRVPQTMHVALHVQSPASMCGVLPARTRALGGLSPLPCWACHRAVFTLAGVFPRPTGELISDFQSKEDLVRLPVPGCNYMKHHACASLPKPRPRCNRLPANANLPVRRRLTSGRPLHADSSADDILPHSLVRQPDPPPTQAMTDAHVPCATA